MKEQGKKDNSPIEEQKKKDLELDAKNNPFLSEDRDKKLIEEGRIQNPEWD